MVFSLKSEPLLSFTTNHSFALIIKFDYNKHVKSENLFLLYSLSLCLSLFLFVSVSLSVFSLLYSNKAF